MAGGGTNVKRSPRELLTNLWTAIIAAGVVLIGAGLLWLSNIHWFDGHGALEATTNQLGGLLVTTGALTFLWELRGRREIISEVLDKTKVSADVTSAGVSRLTMDWLEAPWQTLIKEARHIEVFISYGSTWRNNNWPALQEFARNKDNSLRIYLPDPQDEHTMKVLGQRYSYTLERIQMTIRETAEEFAKLGTSNPADIRIYYRAGDPTFTCYRFDDTVLVTLYSHRRTRSPVPMLILKGGSFGTFFAEDLEAIRDQSTALALDDLIKVGEQNV